MLTGTQRGGRSESEDERESQRGKRVRVRERERRGCVGMGGGAKEERRHELRALLILT